MGSRWRHALAACAVTFLGCARSAGPSRTPSSSAGPPPPAARAIDGPLAGGESAGASAPGDAAPEVTAAWLLYGATLAAASPAATATGYQLELRARSILATTWKATRGALHDPYLDLLVDVSDGGFLSEYVIGFLGRPGWVVPGDDLTRLRLSAFKLWIPPHLGKEHRAETRVEVQGPASQAPVPGSELPAGREIDPGRIPCPTLEPRLSAAVKAWDKDEASLGRVPVTALSSEQLLAGLAWAGSDERARRDGVVFVSPRAVDVLFVAGFCAVERGAFPAAEATLRRAVRLSGGNAGMRAELAQTLILEKKLDEAEAQVDAAIETAESPCQAGILWRKRGYILFDRGRLVASYNAYARSLEFDPQSEIAEKEMHTILAELHHAGSFDESQLKPYKPPPAGHVVVTRCP